jgi:hypothetical protein
MPSERIQRRIDKLLDESDEAYARQDWAVVETTANSALGLDPENEDALAILAAKARMTGESNPFETTIHTRLPPTLLTPFQTDDTKSAHSWARLSRSRYFKLTTTF